MPARVPLVTSNGQDGAVVEQHAVNQATAARYLGVSAETLRRWARANRGPRRSEHSHRVRYRISDLEAWLDAHAVTPGGPAPP